MSGAATALNGQLQHPPFRDAKEFVAAVPRGAYTTAWVREGRLVMDWDTHLVRLAKSLRALHTTLDCAYAAYYAWLQVSGSAPAEPPPARAPRRSRRTRAQAVAQAEEVALQSLLLPGVKACLAAVAAGSGVQQQQQGQPASDQALVIVLPPSASPTGLDVWVQVAPFHSTSSSAPGVAVVLGPPRAVPVGKVSCRGRRGG